MHSCILQTLMNVNRTWRLVSHWNYAITLMVRTTADATMDIVCIMGRSNLKKICLWISPVSVSFGNLLWKTICELTVYRKFTVKNNVWTYLLCCSQTNVILLFLAIECGPPPTLSNHSCREESSTLTTYKTKVKYYCLPGYGYQVDPATASCQGNGKWILDKGPSCPGMDYHTKIAIFSKSHVHTSKQCIKPHLLVHCFQRFSALIHCQ